MVVNNHIVCGTKISPTGNSIYKNNSRHAVKFRPADGATRTREDCIFWDSEICG